MKKEEKEERVWIDMDFLVVLDKQCLPVKSAEKPLVVVAIVL